MHRIASIGNFGASVESMAGASNIGVRAPRGKIGTLGTELAHDKSGRCREVSVSSKITRQPFRGIKAPLFPRQSHPHFPIIFIFYCLVNRQWISIILAWFAQANIS